MEDRDVSWKSVSYRKRRWDTWNQWSDDGRCHDSRKAHGPSVFLASYSRLTRENSVGEEQGEGELHTAFVGL